MAERLAERFFLCMTLARRYEWSGTPLKGRAEPCRGAFTGCRLCRRPLQNSMLGCYDDLSGAEKYSCNMLFYWLDLLFAGGLG